MNNFTFGNERHQYYETIAGGSGAGPDHDGTSAVQTHMTNSRLTDPEILETRLPVRLDQFAIRRGSGGRGAHRAATAWSARSPSSSRCAPTSSPTAGACRRAGSWAGATRSRAATGSSGPTDSRDAERDRVGGRAARRPLRDRNAGRRRVREEGRMINYWPLLGIALVVVGFALRFNPLLVVAVAAIVTGLLGQMPIPEGARHARPRIQREPHMSRSSGSSCRWSACSNATVCSSGRGR